MRKLYRLLWSLPLLGISWLLIDQYVLCPTIQFPVTEPFKGQRIYNPYLSIDSADIEVANFHAHTKSWGGLTNGHGDARDVWRRYDSMGYGFYGVSQYHHIDSFGQHLSNYVPVYEHGVNVKKTHQLVLGAKSVVWKDYIFPQTIDNKQQIINKIAEDPNVLIVLNHPGMKNGYDTSDLKKLYNYDFVEILNPQAQSFSQWDAALSSGHPVFGLADDDVHNVFDNDIIGRYYTIVYGTGRNRSGLFHSLKQGASIAVWVPEFKGENLLQKKNRMQANKQLLKTVTVQGDSISVVFSKEIERISLVGQNGKLLNTFKQVSSVSYTFSPQDTYLRIEALTKDGTRFYLNPFFRY